jgi:trehalose 6-phosphate synthase/phosphatase
VDALGRGDQIKELELKVHPDLKEPLKKLSEDPKTTIVVLSGSGRAVLDKVLLRKFYLFFNVQQHLFFVITTILCRTLANTICGWQRKMECFCDLLQVNG